MTWRSTAWEWHGISGREYFSGKALLAHASTSVSVNLRNNGGGLNSPVEFESDPALSCLNWQGIPLDRKFSALFDGIPCHFVDVEQNSQIEEMYKKMDIFGIFSILTLLRKSHKIAVIGKIWLFHRKHR